MRLAVRLLWRSPGFTAIATLTLAIGIGATTSMFSVVYGTFFAPLPYRNGESVVAVWVRYDGARIPAAPRDVLLWKQHATAFQDLQAWTWRQVNVATGSQPERMQIGPATPGFLSMLGYGEPLLLGRSFSEADGVQGNDLVAILSHRVWQERLGGDRQIVGKPIRLDGQAYTVVGVMRAGQSDRNRNRLWVPLTLSPDQQEWLLVAGRLKPGRTLDQATAELSAIDRHGGDRRPLDPRRTITVEPFKRSFVPDETVSALWLLLAGVAFLLVIACVNVANLLVARGTVRRREFAIRAAIGGSSRAIAQQLIAESLVLATVGGVIGIGAAWLIVRTIHVLLPANLLPTEVEITLNLPVLAFSVVTAATSAVICAVFPAWDATRGRIFEPLKQDGRSSTSTTHRMRRALVAFQCALAVTLLAAGVTVADNLLNLGRADLGFRSDGVMTFGLPITPGRLTSPEQVEAFYATLLARLRQVPQARSVAASGGVPARDMSLGATFSVVGDPRSERPGAFFNMVTPAYFDTLGIRIVRGRAFDDRDRRNSAPVAVVNETFVKRFLNGADALTRDLDVDPPARGSVAPTRVRYRIVGVAADTRNLGPKERPVEEILVPFAQFPWPQATIAIRTVGSSATLQPTVAAIVRSLDPDVPLDAPKTIRQLVSESLAGERFNAVLFSTFGGVGLLLAALGIYGVMSYAVAQQTRDTAIRLAVGATPAHVLGTVVRDGMTSAIVGTVAGVAGAMAVHRVLAAVLVAEHAPLWLVVASVVLLLLTAAFAGCLVPARRAASVDLIQAIRQD